MSTDSPPPSESCGDCDLGKIEDLLCSAKRFQKQADVANESLGQLKGFKDKYATARSDYQSARDKAQEDIDAARTKLEHLLDTLRCKLDDDTERCLDAALKKVVGEIRECAGEPGCCVGPCTFDPSCGDKDTAASLAGRIDQYRRDVKKSTDCFAALLEEQTAIATRVATIKAAVAAIATELAADSPIKDYPRLYARAIVAAWQLKPKQLWLGYPTVNDYVECLCQALTCALEGWEAIAVLEGAKAEKDCKDEATADACAQKQRDIVGGVMGEYVRCCPPDDDDDGDSSPGKDHGCGHQGRSDDDAH